MNCSLFCFLILICPIIIFNLEKSLYFQQRRYSYILIQMKNYSAMLLSYAFIYLFCFKYQNATFISIYLFFIFYFFSSIFISWKLITSQHFSGFCQTLTWISHGVTCIPHPDPPSHIPLHSIPLGLPSAPGPSTCLMHPTWAGDLFHYR